MSQARSGLLRAWECVAFPLVLGIFCAGALGWSLIAAVLYRVLPRRVGVVLGQCAIMRGCRAGLWLMRITGLARFDLAEVDRLRGEAPLVIACNHLSLLDAIELLSRLPRAACIAKAGLWDNPFLGGSVRLAGYLRNDAPLALVRDGAAALRAGSHLIIFPEGTRSDGSGLGAFKPGFVAIARAGGAPVQAVLLHSNTPYLRRGWKLGRMPSFPLIYRARLGRRFHPAGRTKAETAEIAAWFAAELE